MRKATSYLVLILATILLAISATHWTVAQEESGVGDIAAETEASRDREPDNTTTEFENEQEEVYEDKDRYDHDEEHEENKYDFDIEEDLLLLELRAAQAEHAHMLAEISADHVGTASWVISEIHNYLDEEKAAEFLKQLLDDVDDTNIRRLIQLKLIELYSDLDQPEQAKQQLRRLILGK